VTGSDTAVEVTYERLRASRLAAKVRRDVDLMPLTTYRVGGPARLLIEVASTADLADLAAITSETGVETVVIGRGSNLLVADEGFDGLAVVMGSDLAATTIDQTMVSAGGAALLPVVARLTARAGLTGFEWAVGVPGSIGGAVKMNAGGHGSDMAACLVDADVINLHTAASGRRSLAALDLSYRHSSITAGEVVTGARLALAIGDAEQSLAELAEVVRWRRENQPGGQNAGSVFTNPEGRSAGQLIEQAGAKGLRIGTAEVSTKHANFIQSDEGGRACDVVALMAEVRRRVRDTHGIDLTPETHLIGFAETREAT
jgi:UDP-N-acetylmuramate dehydrogenase